MMSALRALLEMVLPHDGPTSVKATWLAVVLAALASRLLTSVLIWVDLADSPLTSPSTRRNRPSGPRSTSTLVSFTPASWTMATALDGDSVALWTSHELPPLK